MKRKTRKHWSKIEFPAETIFREKEKLHETRGPQISRQNRHQAHRCFLETEKEEKIPHREWLHLKNSKS